MKRIRDTSFAVGKLMKSGTTAVFVLLAGAAIGCGAQNAQKQTEWIKYNSAEGRYSILFPAKPELSTQEGPAHSGQKLTQYFATCDDPDLPSAITYAAAYFDLAPGMNYSFDEGRDGYLKAVNATLQSEKPIQIGANAGREIKASANVSGTELILLARFYLVEKRVYLPQFIFPKSYESGRAAEKSAKFFNSFALVNSR